MGAQEPAQDAAREAAVINTTTGETMDEKAAGLALLRAPFAAHQISKLPKPYRKDSPKGQCSECGGYHGLPAVHLDYVGHAAITDRLLEVDPQWSWEPFAVGEDGLPALDRNGGLWIRLTICGVTRIGYGDSTNRVGGDGIKEAIGDALRNAAMRFGAALDLWHKGELHADDEDGKRASRGKKRDGVIKSTDGAADLIDEDAQYRMQEVALTIVDHWRDGDTDKALDVWYADDTFEHREEKVYLWDLLKNESALRTAINNDPRSDKGRKKTP